MNTKHKKEKKEQKRKITRSVIFLVIYYFINALIMTIHNLQYVFTFEWWGLNSLAAIGCTLVLLVYYKFIG